VVRTILPETVVRLGIGSILDAPCGDFHWMSRVELGSTLYIGADILRETISQNRRRHGSPTRQFLHADIIGDSLPRVDLVLCRDGLVHLSNSDARRALENLKAAGRYLLTTTFPAISANRDIATGAWRPINLELPPFGLPAPMNIYNENCPSTSPVRRSKSLALWSL
jgi:hypothetical protein